MNDTFELKRNIYLKLARIFNEILFYEYRVYRTTSENKKSLLTPTKKFSALLMFSLSSLTKRQRHHLSVLSSLENTFCRPETVRRLLWKAGRIPSFRRDTPTPRDNGFHRALIRLWKWSRMLSRKTNKWPAVWPFASITRVSWPRSEWMKATLLTRCPPWEKSSQPNKNMSVFYELMQDSRHSNSTGNADLCSGTFRRTLMRSRTSTGVGWSLPHRYDPFPTDSFRSSRGQRNN